jgi:hypothetical protein
MTSLKPCPFCGKQPSILPDDPDTEGDAWTKVACLNGRCAANPEVISYSDIRTNHRRGAFRKWNKRASDIKDESL